MITTTIVCEKTSRPYRREEEDEIIRWFKDNSILADFCFRRSEAVWRDLRYFPQESTVLEIPPKLEIQYQETLKSFEVLTITTRVHFDKKVSSMTSNRPQYRLVSRGQSFTGQEVIELHVYNQSRGIWQKMPVKVTINPECVIKTLEELENWTKESWSTH